MDAIKRARLRDRGILALEKADEEQELEFELTYLSSLSIEERFTLMLTKSRELKANLSNNGHREASSIVKRK